MIDLIDLPKEIGYWKRKKATELFTFVFLSVVFFVFVLLSLFLSKDDYAYWMWADILLGTIYLWWLLYFFSVPYQETRRRCDFYQGAFTGLFEEDVIVVTSIVKNPSFEKDGLHASLLKGRFEDSGVVYERDFYLLGEMPFFQGGEKIRVKSYTNVILAYEVVS
jgi:hypothetical protein